jgi:hypothetical protein
MPVPTGVALVPSVATAILNTDLGFVATVTGTSDQRVTWSVNGVPGGSAATGTISETGVYAAPGAVPNPMPCEGAGALCAQVTVRATSVPFPGVFAEATVTIVSQLMVFVEDSVGAYFGPPPLGTFSAAPVSVANAPVLANVAPASAAPGSMFTLTLTGANFTDATTVIFALNGAADTAFTVSNVTPSVDGMSLTASVMIGASAASGERIVIVVTPAGNSTGNPIGTNSFTVM